MRGLEIPPGGFVFPEPFVADPDFVLYNGDAADLLCGLESETIDCCVTSPPYWGLRDYGMSQQIGLESDPEAYVAILTIILREVRRVLKPEGTLWLNLGDSYAAGGGFAPNAPSNLARAAGEKKGAFHGEMRATSLARMTGGRRPPAGLKPKDLVGIPWMVAFALQADGWYLRSDIIWSKPNPMPESVTDRPTKAHEYLFMLSKSQQYFYDADAIREADSGLASGNGFAGRQGGARNSAIDGGIGSTDRFVPGAGRNRRSVWEIVTEPYPEAHFAVFPQALVEPCIKAGCPHGGIVLDPFMGSGTTALVARSIGRRSLGIELNPDYCALAAKRLGQQSLLAEDIV